MVDKAAPAQGAHSGFMLTALVGNGYPAIIAFFTGPILAHALGVDGRGAVAAATAPLALITTIATFGIPEAVTFAVARNPRMARAAAARGFVLLAIAGALATLVVLSLVPFLSGGRPLVEFLIRITCIAIVPNLLIGVLRGVASSQQLWRLVSAEKIISSTLRLLTLIPFWLTGTLTPLVAVITVAALPIVGSVVYFRVLRRGEVGLVELTEEARLRGMVSFGSRIWIGSLSGILLSRLDQTLMTPFAGVYQLGLYVVAVSISELPLMINSAVRDITFVSDARQTVNDRLTASARISTLVCLVAGVVLGISMIWWIPLLFGRGFAPSIPVTAILLVAVVFGTPGAIAGAGLSGRGRPGLRSASLVVACATNIALLLLLAPTLGAIGAAIATLVGNLIASNLNLVLLWRAFRIPPGEFYGVRREDLRTLRRVAGRMLAIVTRR